MNDDARDSRIDAIASPMRRKCAQEVAFERQQIMQKHRSEVIEAEMRRLRVEEQQRQESHPLQDTSRIIPSGSEQQQLQNPVRIQGTSESIPIGSTKLPPASAAHASIETTQRKPDSTPKLVKPSGDAAASTTVAKSATLSAPATKQDLNTVANILAKLPRAPTYAIGTRTKKYFQEFSGWFQGTIRSYNEETMLYSIEYEDNDTEELEQDEIDTGTLPTHMYEIGTQYDIYFWSKESGKKIGWFVGTIQSKYYHDPNHGKGQEFRGSGWRYNVVYSDGESEDVDESYITQNIKKSQKKRCRREVKRTAEDPGVGQEDSNEQEDGSSSDEESPSSEDEDESSDDGSASSENEGDPNPDRIPYWTGKQHHQFILGLQMYGLGNLEDIHEAECIPDRSFRELVRYWYWYVSDMDEKGLVLNYEAKGTVNGKKGRKESIDEDTNAQEEKEEPKAKSNSKGYNVGKWSDEETEMVAKALALHGSSYKSMSNFVKTRSPKQINKHFNRNKKRITKLSQKYLHEASTIIEAESKTKIKVESKVGRKEWSPAQHAILVEALVIYGYEYKEIEAYMKCRTTKQIQNYVKRRQKTIEKEVKDKKGLFKKQFPKKTNNWTCYELSRLVEGYALFKKDFKRIADYVKTREEDQVGAILEAQCSQFEDESDFDLGDRFSFPIELYHVLNIAPFEGFCHIISWSEKGDSVLIHDNDQFSSAVFPRFSHKGIGVEKFYDNLELFEFQKKSAKMAKENSGTYRHPAFQKADYRKVEQFCRKAFA